MREGFGLAFYQAADPSPLARNAPEIFFKKRTEVFEKVREEELNLLLVRLRLGLAQAQVKVVT